MTASFYFPGPSTLLSTILCAAAKASAGVRWRISRRHGSGSRVILKTETYHFHRLDLTRLGHFIVTIYERTG